MSVALSLVPLPSVNPAHVTPVKTGSVPPFHTSEPAFHGICRQFAGQSASLFGRSYDVRAVAPAMAVSLRERASNVRIHTADRTSSMVLAADPHERDGGQNPESVQGGSATSLPGSTDG